MRTGQGPHQRLSGRSRAEWEPHRRHLPLRRHRSDKLRARVLARGNGHATAPRMPVPGEFRLGSRRPEQVIPLEDEDLKDF